MRRAVLDPNVLVSARLSPRGAPGMILAAWLEGRFELIVSPRLLTELVEVLGRWMTVEEAREYVQALRVGATLVDDPPPRPHEVRDPDDVYLLALAQDAEADQLVSGDGDLTSLIDVSPPVLTPREFLASLDA